MSRTLRLERGDVLRIVGSATSMNIVAQLLGPIEPSAAETDMMTTQAGPALLAAAVVVMTLPIGAAPTLGYTGTYAFANVILTIYGSLAMFT